MEGLGWFMLGAGVALLCAAIPVGWNKFSTYRRKKLFNAFVGRLKQSMEKSQPDPESGPTKDEREISELTFRDKMGEMNTVRIVIDPNVMDKAPKNKEELDALLASGDAGKLSDIISGSKIEHEPMKKVQEFVFSPGSVRAMRSAGMEPDEVVTKMLRASGRID